MVAESAEKNCLPNRYTAYAGILKDSRLARKVTAAMTRNHLPRSAGSSSRAISRSNNSFFFFPSRRRHTSSYGDWSSDVCSSDLRLVRSGDTGEGGGSYRYVFDCNTARDRSPSHVSHDAVGSRMWVGRWGNHPAAGQYLAPIVEHDHAVAQQAPPLLRVKGDDAGGVAVRALSRGAGGPVWTHYAPLIWAPDVPVWAVPVL